MCVCVCVCVCVIQCVANDWHVVMIVDIFGCFCFVFLFLCNNGITHGYGLWNHDQRVFFVLFFRFVFCG